MYHIVLTIIFSFIFAQSIQTASEQVNATAAQPYTAKQHFQDIKELLPSIQYTAPKNTIEIQNNKNIKHFIEFLNEKLQKEHTLFFENAVPTFLFLIQRKKFVIPQDSKDHVREKLKILLEKRAIALKTLKKLKEEKINFILDNL